MSETSLIVVAELHGITGRVDELRALLAELTGPTRAEPECIAFRVLAADEPGEVVILQTWRSEAGLRAHYATPHYRQYRDNVGPLLARPSDVLIHHVDHTIRPLDPNPPDPGMMG